MTNIIPLTVRSHYSLMHGTASVQALCRAARQMGYDRLALTDTDNLYGLWPFLAACRREGLTPIVGAEISEPGSRRRGIGLVEDTEGYRNLCRLLSRRHLEPDFRLETALPPLARGLTVLTADVDLLKRWHAGGVRVVGAMPRRLAPRRRTRSPVPGGSTLITSAPWSPSSMVATGPEIIVVRSRMRIPSSAPAMHSPPGASMPRPESRR